MTTQEAKDILLIAESYRRNRERLIEALLAKGFPISWLSSWTKKLERLAKAAKAALDNNTDLLAACEAGLERLQASCPPEGGATEAVCKLMLSAIAKEKGGA